MQEALAEQPTGHLTLPEKQTIIAEALALVESGAGVTRASLARATGYSASAIRGVLLGCYKSDPSDVLRAIGEYLARHKLRRIVDADPPFRRTQVSDRIYEALEVAHLQGTITMVLAPAGVGKSASVRAYARQHTRVILVLAGPGCTGRSTLALLAGRLGVAHSLGAATLALRARVIEALTDTDSLLCIDEADELPEESLQTLRIVAEEAGVGLAIIGTPQLLAKLRAKRSDTIAQFLSRVRFPEIVTHTPDSDIRVILRGQRLARDVVAELVSHARGTARRAVTVLAGARLIADGDVTPSDVREASERLDAVSL